MARTSRVTTEQPFTLTQTLTPQDSETPTDPDGSAVTFALTHVNGTLLVAAAAATRTGAGVYKFVVPAQSQVANAVATWTYAVNGVAASITQSVTILQSHYMELSELRALDGLADTSMYPTATLVDKRDDAETLFEMATGVFWTPHYVRDVLDGDPNYRVALQSAIRDVIDYIPMKRLILLERYPSQLLTVAFIDPNTGDLLAFGPPATTLAATYSGGATMTVASTLQNTATPFAGSGPLTVAGIAGTVYYTSIDGTHFYGCTGNLIGSATTPAVVSVPLSAFYLIYSSGELEAQMGVPAFPRGMENVIIEYVAGRSAMPSDLRLALAKYIRYLVLNTNARIPDRATSMTTEFGTFRIGQADDWLHPTGINEVDAVIRRYGERLPSFA